ncbi:hypothetical protein OSTOST_24184 [Ostertagia ostertagi]
MNENSAICEQVPSEQSSATEKESTRWVEIFEARNQYITTYYSVCWVLVKNPGDVLNATNSSEYISWYIFSLPTVITQGSIELKQFLDWPRILVLERIRASGTEWKNGYSDLGVSIYEEDAMFLDLVETMVPTTMQSALFTFISMFVVACSCHI